MEEKRTGLFENGLIWFGAGVSIAEILTGTYLAPLGMGKGLLAIIVGHIIGCLMLFLAGVIGGKVRKSAMETVKMSFGQKGSILFAVLNVLQLVGWTAIMFTAGTDLPALVQDAHTAGVKVVCSSHDFHKTPPKAEMVSRMVAMQQAGADLPKLAVMPQSRADVLELLAATAEMTDHHPETPVITMSMGALGAVSRLCGEAFGSAMTFANPGTASAPGQVGLDVVNAVLDSLRLN